MQKISWTDRLKHVEVLHVVEEETSNLRTKKKKIILIRPLVLNYTDVVCSQG